MAAVARYNRLSGRQKKAEYRGQRVTLYKPTREGRTGDNKLVVYVVDGDGSDEGGKVRKVQFGHRGYADFTEHKDEKRRENYCKRSRGIHCARGSAGGACAVTSANFWSRMVLWDCPPSA